MLFARPIASEAAQTVLFTNGTTFSAAALTSAATSGNGMNGMLNRSYSFRAGTDNSDFGVPIPAPVAASTVPEACTWALLLVGLAAVGVVSRNGRTWNAYLSERVTHAWFHVA